MGHYVNFKEELQQRTDYAEEVIRRWLRKKDFQNDSTGDELQHAGRRQETELDSSIIWRDENLLNRLWRESK